MGEVVAHPISDKDLVLYKIYEDSYNSIKTSISIKKWEKFEKHFFKGGIQMTNTHRKIYSNH